MRRLIVLAGLCLAAIMCGPDEPADHQAEWRQVLEHKKAAHGPEASPQQKQVYADSLAAFARRHPNHGRAREVYQRIQLEFANELASLGRYQDAIRFYRSVLARDPGNENARRGLIAAVDRLAVTRDKLLLLEKGMSRKQVTRILGQPIPGWMITSRRRDRETSEAWYYRTTTGGLAGVYFREGRLFAAEENSQAQFGL